MIEGEDRELFARSLAHATEAGPGAKLDEALAELGWRDALEADPRTAVSLLFEQQGRTAVTSSAIDTVVLHALGCELGAETGVVLPTVGETREPGRATGDAIEVRGLGTAGLERASEVVAAVSDGAEGSTLAVVKADQLTMRPIGGLDPRLGWLEVGAAGARPVDELPGSAPWQHAVAAAQRAVAHELVGASRTMLQLARDHAVDRIQFGQPIARFQAVRHRLAEAYVAVEAAAAAADAAWEEATPLAAAVAKATASRSARTVARHAQQVLAGIGFTAEHGFHHYVRRILVLDGLFGRARSLTSAMGEELLRTRHLPDVLPL